MSSPIEFPRASSVAARAQAAAGGDTQAPSAARGADGAVISDRVTANTSPAVNLRIARATEASVRRAVADGQAGITRRLAQLDREWDIERYLETGASSLTLLGVALGATSDKRWFLLPAVVAGFLLNHAVQGWAPPLPVLRRLGVRTADEINRERYALRALRGDVMRIGVPAHEEAARPAPKT
jgi:hypothetical protein